MNRISRLRDDLSDNMDFLERKESSDYNYLLNKIENLNDKVNDIFKLFYLLADRIGVTVEIVPEQEKHYELKDKPQQQEPREPQK
jgi:hypothetical protein